MSDTSILQRLRDILRETSEEDRDWDQVDGATTIESLGVDSLSILDLLYDIEQEFGVSVAGSEVVNLRTVGEIETLLKDRGAQ